MADGKTTIWRRLMCRLGHHKRYAKVARVSLSSDHIVCPDCGAEFGINHDVRHVLPWDEVRHLYVGSGYDDRAAVRKALS